MNQPQRQLKKVIADAGGEREDMRTVAEWKTMNWINGVDWLVARQTYNPQSNEGNSIHPKKLKENYEIN